MIYDCFLFYDEDMLLDIRLNTLYPHVDWFVIVESRYTFTGKKREKLHFDISKYEKFKDKIIYVINEAVPVIHDKSFKSNCSVVEAGQSDPWENETVARNSIMLGLKNAQDNDIIIISDVDEIINSESISQFSHFHLCTILHQNFYNYKFNIQVLNNDGSARKCKLPKMVKFKVLKKFFLSQPDLLRNVKRRGSVIRESWLRWNWLKYRTKTLNNGGWHFSWVMTDERISEKMSTISHTEHNTPEFNNPDHIRRCVENNQDLWNRQRVMKVIPMTKEFFPDYLVNKKDELAAFIRQEKSITDN